MLKYTQIIMEKKIQQLIIKTLEEEGYEVNVESDGIYVDEEDSLVKKYQLR